MGQKQPTEKEPEFQAFMESLSLVCIKFGIYDPFSYGTMERLFQELVCRFPKRLLVKLDKQMGDDYLSDDLLGSMHRAVRDRLQVDFGHQFDVAVGS